MMHIRIIIRSPSLTYVICKIFLTKILIIEKLQLIINDFSNEGIIEPVNDTDTSNANPLSTTPTSGRTAEIHYKSKNCV